MRRALWFVLAAPAWAIWMSVGQPVPIDRVVANLQTQLKDHSNDASAWLVLARVHSYAFFTGSKDVPMRGDSAFFDNVPRGEKPPNTSPENLEHLKQSIAAFRKSIELDPKPALPYLGLGWDLEQDTPLGNQNAALDNYRKAFDIASQRELAEGYFGPGYEAISQEAGERIISIQAHKPNDAAARAEVSRLQPMVTKLRQKPRAITPVIFSFHEGAALHELVAQDVRVSFDLDGQGGASWTWLQPTTGILVWDPLRTGNVHSGLQLFGSVTWWMFWRDGYQALASLDDNHDGWLSGAELAGLAVWIDRNQNGKSDPGEVVPLAEAGILRIAVTAAPDGGRMLANPQGIEFSDGRRTPSYDWIATSVTSTSVTR